MRARAGTSLISTVDETTIVVVRAPDRELDVRCGGAPMIDAKGPRPDQRQAGVPGGQAGAQLGKRYVNAADDLEVLVTKAGAGSLADGDEVLQMKAAKPLPASD
ncbi:MAG TPA: hypothetical protein VK802_26210 [Streptosporangiaceae bacterium]|jgi:hypothetical protein|nr:hypothetical protein [Streptosporangiaceae bacterium]